MVSAGRWIPKWGLGFNGEPARGRSGKRQSRWRSIETSSFIFFFFGWEHTKCGGLVERETWLGKREEEERSLGTVRYEVIRPTEEFSAGGRPFCLGAPRGRPKQEEEDVEKKEGNTQIPSGKLSQLISKNDTASAQKKNKKIEECFSILFSFLPEKTHTDHLPRHYHSNS